MNKRKIIAPIIIAGMVLGGAGNVSAQVNSDLNHGNLNTIKLSPIKGDDPTNIIVEEGPRYTWTKIETIYSSTQVYNASKNFLIGLLGAAVGGGAGAYVAKKITQDAVASGAIAGMAGYISNDITKALQDDDVVYITTERYYDRDAYDVHVKYEVSIYSDAARTNLIDSYFQIETF